MNVETDQVRQAEILQRRMSDDTGNQRLRDEFGEVLRELRGELGAIRSHLDTLVAIEGQLRYQGQRISAMDQRMARLAETALNPSNSELRIPNSELRPDPDNSELRIPNSELP